MNDEVPETLVRHLIEVAYAANQQCGMRDEAYASFSCDIARLESSISAPFQGLFGYSPYQTVVEKAAALLVYTALGHAFMDGNKRTALQVSLYFLKLRKIEIAMPSPEAGAQLVIDAVQSDEEIRSRVNRAAVVLNSWVVPDADAQSHRDSV